MYGGVAGSESSSTSHAWALDTNLWSEPCGPAADGPGNPDAYRRSVSIPSIDLPHNTSQIQVLDDRLFDGEDGHKREM